MSDEITLTLSFDVTNGNYAPGTIRISSQKLDQAAAGAQEGIQNIGTSEETLTDTNLSTKGWLYIRNMDAVNYISWGFATGDYGGKLEAGEFAIFRTLSSEDIYLLANTAACDLYYRWLED